MPATLNAVVVPSPMGTLHLIVADHVEKQLHQDQRNNIACS